MPPVAVKEKILIRSDSYGKGYFNARRSGGRRRHKGLDIAGYTGEPVYAAKSGIARTGEVPGGMGKYVKIFHPDGYATVYGHLSAIDISDKAWVWQGERIASVGKTGNANYPSMQPHLHFEIKKNDAAIDPLPEISPLNK